MVCTLPSQETSTSTVLIIDDNEDHRKYWSHGLRNSTFRYSVLEASNGESGLGLYRDKKVDCVVLDLDMPESGFHTLLELIPDRHHPKVAVVILTHLVHPVLSEIAKHNGAQDWLVKQYTSAEDLAHAIHRAVVSVQSLQ